MNSIVALPIAAAIPVVAPAMAVPASGNDAGGRNNAHDDGRLLEKVDRIFKLRDVIDEFDPEIRRLQEIWTAEMIRLYEEDLTDAHPRSSAERHAIVAAMPECIEHSRFS